MQQSVLQLMGEAPIFPSTTLLPLSEHNTVWELAAPYASASQTERVVITVAIHGNEPCGVLVRCPGMGMHSMSMFTVFADGACMSVPLLLA